MPELLTMQDLANGHLDIKALGEAANGDENTIVTTRTGNTYPSAERAINIMFKNGGLPATPFATKALMTASALADGDYAIVINDGNNNGLYEKTSGAWNARDFFTDNIARSLAVNAVEKSALNKGASIAFPLPSVFTGSGYINSSATSRPGVWYIKGESAEFIGFKVDAGTTYTVYTKAIDNRIFYGVYFQNPIQYQGAAGTYWEPVASSDSNPLARSFTIPAGVNYVYFNIKHLYPLDATDIWLNKGSYSTHDNTSEVSSIYGIGLADTKAREMIADINISASHKIYDYNHFLLHGQSLSVGTNSGSVISTSQPYENVTINGGVKSTQVGTNFIPLVEAGTETPCSAAANTAVREANKNKGWKPSDYRVVATTSGVDGRPIDQLSEGGQYWGRVGQQISQAHLIASNLNKSHAVHAVGWIQGEANNQPTSFPNQLLSRQQYYDALIALQGQLDRLAKKYTKQSETVKLITYQVSYSSLDHPDVALAQLDAVQKNDSFGLATPTYHIQHSADKVHLTALGYKHMGAYFGRAYYQFIIEGRKPDYINPRNVVNNNGVITIEFDVPKLPLVIDAVKLASTEDSGFKVVGAVSRTKLPIISITTDSNKVVISLETPTTEQVEVRYGLDYVGTGLNIKNAASGNLRDSTTETVTVSGQVLPLFHVCPHFKLLSFKDSGI